MRRFGFIRAADLLQDTDSPYIPPEIFKPNDEAQQFASMSGHSHAPPRFKALLQKECHTS